MMQSHLKDAQLKYLQAQINPHFLFNTLNAGAQLAMMEDAAKTEQFLMNVSEFFRYNVRKGEEPVVLGEEIHLVDNYVYILNVRFAGEILYEKDIDESLSQVPVPGMLLQPLVENAVNYGIRNIDWERHIELTVCRQGDEICISVWDNGAGMTKERIRQVLAGEVPSEPSGTNNGVGMRNVMERLRLFYNGGARLEIFSEGINRGTEVVIHIPYMEEERDVSSIAG
jgi:sensor histidine kinase YesM